MKINSILILFFSIGLLAQNPDGEKRLRDITTAAKAYLVGKKELDNKATIKEYFILEVLSNEPLATDEKGIYRLFSKRCPFTTFIILVGDEKFEIVDLENFPEAMRKVYRFLDGYDPEIAAAYATGVQKAHKMNQYDE